MKQESNFAIMRFEKLSTLNAVTRSLKHIFREQPTPNANTKRNDLNENLITKVTTCAEQSVKIMNDRISRLDKAPRANAVLAIEIIFTASPEAMETMDLDTRRSYFKDCVRWFGKKVGPENILVAQIHRDESSEHLHFLCLPIVAGENTLNCRKLIGGHKNRASELQDEFFKVVGEKYGLTRGNRGSRQTHTSLQEHNALVNQALPKLRAQKLELKLECDELEKRIARGKSILENLALDIKKAMEEHAQAVRYCFTALKERLMDRWGMIYEGNGKFTREAQEYVEEVIEKPSQSYTRPSFRR